MKCSKCGTHNDNNRRLCSQCGRLLEDDVRSQGVDIIDDVVSTLNIRIHQLEVVDIQEELNDAIENETVAQAIEKQDEQLDDNQPEMVIDRIEDEVESGNTIDPLKLNDAIVIAKAQLRNTQDVIHPQQDDYQSWDITLPLIPQESNE